MKRMAYSAGLICAAALLTSPAIAQNVPSVAFTALTAAGEFTSALTTINGGFFNQNSAFVSSPDAPGPNQIGGGPWVRATGGTFNTTGTGVATFTLPGVGTSAPETIKLKTQSDYNGVQAGADIGRYNLGASGYSVNFGITGGYVSVNSRGTGILADVNFDVPFVGGYVAFAGHGFFADAIVREDFLSITTDPAALSTSLNATTFATSFGYRYDLPDAFFVTPSAAISLSWLDAGNLAVQRSAYLDQGTAHLNSVESQLGRLNVTIGKDFVTQNLLISPFFTASVFNEFASAAKASYTDTDPLSASGFTGVTTNGSTSRVGTYGQFSLGVNAKVAGTGLLSFVRGDIRTGDHVDGYSVSGGLRYQF